MSTKVSFFRVISCESPVDVFPAFTYASHVPRVRQIVASEFYSFGSCSVAFLLGSRVRDYDIELSSGAFVLEGLLAAAKVLAIGENLVNSAISVEVAGLPAKLLAVGAHSDSVRAQFRISDIARVSHLAALQSTVLEDGEKEYFIAADEKKLRLLTNVPTEIIAGDVQCHGSDKVSILLPIGEERIPLLHYLHFLLECHKAGKLFATFEVVLGSSNLQVVVEPELDRVTLSSGVRELFKAELSL